MMPTPQQRRLMTRACQLSALLVLCVVAGSPGFSQAPAAPTLYGHRAYPEAPAAELRPVGEYRATGRTVRLREPAAAAFLRMQKEAQAEGVALIPISGHRTRAYQERLFQRAIKKYGSPERAARWVAPPGHSEHHTGLALDVGDGTRPGCDVQRCFEKTSAYAWLKKNAARFGFELSFPPEGAAVAFEPWHWRFTADPERQEAFHH